jgi:3alpha(or 20beta)-hydroxysteroid dehydrogenase
VGGRLLGKVALITGAGTGMGRAHAERMVREGATVYVTDIDLEAAHRVAEEAGARALHLDVRSEDGWRAVAAAVAERGSRLHILVNNAGILRTAPLEQTSLEDWDNTLAINLTGAFLGLKTMAPLLRAAGGSSVVNVSSPAGLQGRTNMTAYSSSKFGLRGLTQSAALELAPDGVRVNSIHPGTVRTQMLGDAQIDALAARIPLGRIGEPDDIASLVVFLASDESSYITGSEFVADGGRHAGPTRLSSST